jgi:hypothetical protein
MLCAQHERMVRRAAGLLGIHNEALEQLAKGSVFPDGADDILVGGKKEVLGARLCSATHLCVATTPGLFRGWSWASDPSTKWLDIPDENVECDPGPWAEAAIEAGCAEAVAKVWSMRHPQLALVLTPGYNLALDATTFAGAHSMAAWQYELLERCGHAHGTATMAAWFAAGCITHDLLDQYVPYHSNGWILWRPRNVCRMHLLRGPTHTQYEVSCLEHWQKNESRFVDDGDDHDPLVLSARGWVERASFEGRRITSPAVTNRLAWAALLDCLDQLASRIA